MRTSLLASIRNFGGNKAKLKKVKQPLCNRYATAKRLFLRHLLRDFCRPLSPLRRAATAKTSGHLPEALASRLPTSVALAHQDSSSLFCGCSMVDFSLFCARMLLFVRATYAICAMYAVVRRFFFCCVRASVHASVRASVGALGRRIQGVS